jgi:outer membrane protein
MHRISRGLIVSGIMALVGLGALPGFAQNAPAAAPKAPAAAPAKPAAAAPTAVRLKTPIIAVVDAQALIDRSEAAKGAQVKIEALAGDLQKKIAVEEEALKAEERALQSQQAILSAEAYAKKRQDLQKKVSDLERKVVEARRWLTTTREGVARHIHSALVEVVGKLAEERGVDLVIPSSQILYTTASLNLTTEAMARLNKRLPEVAVNPVFKDPADVKP